MRRIESADVTAGANAEVLGLTLQPEPGKKITLRKVSCEVTAAVRLVVYLNTTKIADIPGEIDYLVERPVELDVVANQGDRIKIGLKDDTGSGVTKYVMAEYDQD